MKATTLDVEDGADTHAQRELRVARERLRFLLSATPAVIYTAAPSINRGRGAITFVSDNVREQLGYGPDEFVCRPGYFLQRIHAGDAPRIEAELRQVMERGSHAFEYRFYRQDGSLRWIRDDCRLVRDAAGKAVELVGYWLDVTERKLAQDAAEAKEAQLEETQRITKIGSWHWNLSDRLVCTPELYRIFGRDPENSRDDKFDEFLNLIHRDDLTMVQAALSQAVEGISPYSIHYRVNRPDGTLRVVHAEGQLILDRAGQPVRMVGTAQDITEQKRAEEETRRLTTRLTNTLESITDAFFILDPDWRFTYINSEAERLLQRRREDLLGKNAWVEFPTAAGTAYEREYRRAVAEGRPVFFEQFDVPLNAWMEVRAYPSVEGLAVYFRDNTEQRRTRAALVEQAALLDKANDVIVVRDLEHRVLSWNRSAERLYGWSAAEAIGKKTTDLLHTDAAILEAANRELLEKDGWTGELRQRTKDGREVWVECHWSLLRDELGQPTSTLVIAADITARRQANEKLHALLRENTRLVVAVESAPTGILIVDPNQPDLPIIFANSAFCKMTGYEEKEILGRNCRFLQGAETDRRVLAQMRQAIAEHRPFRTKLINYKRDGTPFWNSLRINPIWNEAGDLMDYVGIQVDVTEHIEAQEQLRQKQANLALAQRVAHLGSWEQEIIGEGEPCLESLRWSEETYRIFGHEPDAAAPPWDLFTQGVHPADLHAVLSAFTEANHHGKRYSIDHRILWPDGTERIVHEEADMVSDAETGKIIKVFGTVQDITERKRNEEALRELSVRLLEAQDAEQRRIARELHDSTAQELASVAMNLGLLEQRLGSSDPVAANLLADNLAVLQQCSREISTISHLLHPPLLDEMGLDRALRQFAEGFTERSGICVTLSIADNLGRLTPEIETALFRVTQEALSNINRHSGGSTATIRLRRPDGHVELDIADNGRGLPEGIFSPAFEGGAKLGVGLPGMRERLRQLGGQFELISNASGTTVKATVPVPKALP